MTETRNGKAYRGVRYRLIPVTRDNALFLFAMCGACRFVWNFGSIPIRVILLLPEVANSE